jgi:hypothetical protein
MKAKAQLLLKKMKSSLDVSWNEKGELKYKGEIVQGSNMVWFASSYPRCP